MDCKQKTTKQALLLHSFFNAPFWALYTFVAFILYKELSASPFQIACFIAVKPAVSLLSTYWSSYITHRSDRLITNISWGVILGKLPFFILPFYPSANYLIFASGWYMLFVRGTVPAWMELVRANLSERDRERSFSYASMMSYLLGSFLSLQIGVFMDSYVSLWPYLFIAFSLFSWICLLFFVKLSDLKPELSTMKDEPNSLKDLVFDPWKRPLQLLLFRKDFRGFQVVFLLGGSALMIIQPAIPSFFIDELSLTYIECAAAFTFCKGIGFFLTSRRWSRYIHSKQIFLFTSAVTFLAGIFPLILIGAKAWIFAIYPAYVLYGIMQAGSEMSWHLSGPIFSKDEDSSTYTSINVLMVGIRGVFAPWIGSWLLLNFKSMGVLVISALLCFIATAYAIYCYRRYKEPTLSEALSS